jgi:CIC family chloride channel protein
MPSASTVIMLAHPVPADPKPFPLRHPIAALRAWWSVTCRTEPVLVGAAVLIGVLTACVNFVFHDLIARAHELFWVDLAGALSMQDLPRYDIFEVGFAGLPRYWPTIPLIPIIGMAVIVALERRFPGEIKGYGMPRFLELVNITGGFLRRRWITLKTLSSAITIGAGMSAGIEGPVAQIGGSIGSTVGRVLQPTFDRLRVLIACGSAAGIAAAYGSPIAGVMFAQEIVLASEFEAKHFYLIILAAGASAVAAAQFSGVEHVMTAPDLTFSMGRELPLYVLLGVISGFLAVMFIHVFYGIRDRFTRLEMSENVKPLLGGAIVGVSLIFFPQASAMGYDTISHTFDGTMATRLLVSLVVVKMLMTSVTLGCGGCGGVFTPAMFIGATLGGSFAGIANYFFPGAVAEPGAFALVGMGAFLAAATHAPMTAIFMAWELTGNIASVVPAMIASVIGTLIAQGLLGDSIDTYELRRKGFDVHRSRTANILGNLFVRGLVTREYLAVPRSMGLGDFVLQLTNTRYTYFPVIDEKSELLGVIQLEDLREVLGHRDAWPYIIVDEVARRDIATVKTTDTLYDAMNIMNSRGIDEIPVVDPDAPRRLVGMLRRREVDAFYEKRLMTGQSAG